MATKQLGKMEQVALREVWQDEARDFTPWLASEVGLALLGETIDLKLELVQQEATVGPFSADILAREFSQEDHFVVIENQLGGTDHDHLGKLITYAANLKARTLIWVAEFFTDEHRQAIDWLNENQGESISFYALQIEAWRIGDSLPAPKFRIISSPNPYERAVQQKVRGALSETGLIHLKFWEEVRGYFQFKKTALKLRKPRADYWYAFALGRTFAELDLSIYLDEKYADCQIYLYDRQAYQLLCQQQNEIERELGYSLEWQPIVSKSASRILIKKNADIDNPQERQELKEWFFQTAEQLHKVFSPRVIALQFPKVSNESEDEK